MKDSNQEINMGGISRIIIVNNIMIIGISTTIITKIIISMIAKKVINSINMKIDKKKKIGVEIQIQIIIINLYNKIWLKKYGIIFLGTNDYEKDFFKQKNNCKMKIKVYNIIISY